METETLPADFDNLTREELVARLKALQSHNTQLRNIIAKNSSNSAVKKTNKKPFDFSKCSFRHVLLKFYYLGWDYQGYVTQEDTSNTIEFNLFNALIKTCLIQDRSNSNYHRCGRTDKGVSAFSQVISIKLRSKSLNLKEELDYCKILNKVLPPRIQCVAWCPIKDSFSARFDCKSRTYKYFFPKSGLNLDLMTRGANYLIGTHDYRNFCKMDVNNGVVEFTRNISLINIEPFNSSSDEDNFGICVITITGKAFLWHQIRCIMGILLLIGQTKEEPEIVLELLDVEKNSRRPDYQMASEIPLNLYHSEYEDVEWIYDNEAISLALKSLWEHWTFTEIKASMMQSMITDLSSKCEDVNFNPSQFLVQLKSKSYVPVMKRQLCDSLEDKIEHYKKRNKLS